MNRFVLTTYVPVDKINKVLCTYGTVRNKIQQSKFFAIICDEKSME